jgi:hypothetical protein
VVRDSVPSPFDSMIYCFETKSWGMTFSEDNIIVLDTIFRQGKDLDFIKILQGIREGKFLA